MKKRTLALVMTASMVTGLLAGCGSTASSGNTGSTTAAESTQSSSTEASQADDKDDSGFTKDDITLTIWHIATDEKRHEAIAKSINRFMEQHPNIKVQEVANENDPYKTKLATSMAAGEEPDVFISWGGGWLESFVDEGKVLDIDEWVKDIEDEYYPSALSLFQLKDKYYGLPYSCGPVCVYYNKQIYADLGLEIPTTLSEFEANCDKIKEAGIIPLALGNAGQWPAALTFTYLSMRYGGKQPFLDAYNRENGGTFEDESFIKAGEKIQEWVNKGYYPEGCNGINYDTGGSRMLFYNGLAAQIVQTNGLFTNCKTEAPDFYDNNLGIFAFPVIEDGNGNAKEILGGGQGYSISASCKYPKEAFALIHTLTDKEFGQDSVDIAGTISGVKGVNVTNELTKEADDLLQSAEYIQNYYDQFLPVDMAALHKQTTYDLVGGTITPQEAASQMEELAKKTLDK